MTKTSAGEASTSAGNGVDRFARSLFECLPLGIVVTDSRGKLLEANQAARDQLGLGEGPGESAERRFLRADGSVLPPAEHPNMRALGNQCVLTNEQVGMIGPDGETTWFQVTATPLTGLGVVTTYYDVSLGRQTEDDLRHHLSQLDAFFNTDLDLLAILNSDGQAIRLNPAWRTLLGYDLDQTDGTRVLDYIHPADMELALGALARLRTPKEVVGFVCRMRHHHGSYRFLEYRATAADDLIYITARDITDRLLAEAALRESEARFRAIFEQATVGVAEADVETGRFIRANQRFCEIVGYSQNELLSLTFGSLTHPEDLPEGPEILKQFQADGISDACREKRCLHKDGHVVWINQQVKALSEPGLPVRHLVVVIEDISERKETDELLRTSLTEVLEANQRLNFHVTRMPLGYVAWNLEFGITEWNASAERIFGWSADEAIGKSADHLLVPPDMHDKATQVWGAVVEASDFQGHAVLDNCTRSGQRITCEWFCAPCINASGKIVGCLAMVHDITERLRVEEKVLHSQRMESLGSFAGGVAHDMSNLIRTIASVSRFTQDSAPDAESTGQEHGQDSAGMRASPDAGSRVARLRPSGSLHGQDGRLERDAGRSASTLPTRDTAERPSATRVRSQAAPSDLRCLRAGWGGHAPPHECLGCHAQGGHLDLADAYAWRERGAHRRGRHRLWHVEGGSQPRHGTLLHHQATRRRESDLGYRQSTAR
jgi:PAS domain S-box-containing protein